MDKHEFSQIRHRLNKSQKQMSQLLGTSLKAVQSFEQGWRKVPVHIERQMLYLLAMKESKRTKPCWVVQSCPRSTKERCPAWEFHSGKICWFINGTFCRGQVQDSWSKKMEICRDCGVFKSSMAL